MPAPPDCQRCPALAANRRCVVNGYGDPRARVMVVGEAPGRHGADRTGVPFTGDRSGRRLQALLIRAGLSWEEDPAMERPRLRRVFLTNVVRCNPPGNRNPTPQETANCAPFLREELEAVRPAVVVAVGWFAARWAFAELLGQRPPAGMRALHGRRWAWLAAADRRPGVLLCLVHPARVSRQQWQEAEEALAAVLREQALSPSISSEGCEATPAVARAATA
ncbi:MAG: uracil-DNA glycosylase [Anaerolineae bacterium]|nr:uracil-DNA glycosylase [Anaerolineae bacterium]